MQSELFGRGGGARMDRIYTVSKLLTGKIKGNVSPFA
jgi:hypothetical protein